MKHGGSEGKDEGQFMENHGIVVNSEGNVYVVDTRNVRIQKFDTEDNFLIMWGFLGCKYDQFLIPHDIAMDSKVYIYVTDSGKSHFRANYDCNHFKVEQLTSIININYLNFSSKSIILCSSIFLN